MAPTGGVGLNGDALDLPALCTLDDCDGDWEIYTEHLYSGFCEDFVENPVGEFGGLRFGLKRGPAVDAKEPTFWHLLSKERGDERRTRELKRGERLRWPRAIIGAAQAGHHSIVRWRRKHGREFRVLLALSDFSYLVVLVERGEYILLWTAFPVDSENERRKLRRQWQAGQKG